MSVEIKPQWLNIVKRMQSVGRKYDGLTVLKMSVIVNGDGVPVFWHAPKVVTLEPRLSMDIDTLKGELGEENLLKVLNIIMNNV